MNQSNFVLAVLVSLLIYGLGQLFFYSASGIGFIWFIDIPCIAFIVLVNWLLWWKRA